MQAVVSEELHGETDVELMHKSDADRADGRSRTVSMERGIIGFAPRSS